MKRWRAVRVHLAVEILVGLESRIRGITELSELFIRRVIARKRARPALRM
jgi:hypothetical protein